MFGDLSIKDVKSQIGLLARTLRKKEKLSQHELAEKLSISRLTVQNLESGKNATLDTMLKVMQHFDKLKVINEVFANEIRNNNYESLY